MAVRDDFTAGEVLAAADLNDTFASKPPFAYGTATPSTTVEGFIWYDENDTPPAPKFWDGSAFQAISAPSGLVHVATESFSAVSSVSLNGVFTSAYENYKIIAEFSGSTSGANTNLRYRAAGSDESAALYYYQRVTFAGTTVSAERVSTATNIFLTTTDGTNETHLTDFVISNPFAATTTRSNMQSSARTTVVTARQVSSWLNTTTQYDGFSFIHSTGTMTGTIRVYGYQNS
jgi:hypothetical protein